MAALLLALATILWLVPFGLTVSTPPAARSAASPDGHFSGIPEHGRAVAAPANQTAAEIPRTQSSVLDDKAVPTGSTLVGRVMWGDSHTAVSGARVELLAKSGSLSEVLSGEDGGYTFRGVLPGPVALVAIPPTNGNLFAKEEVTVADSSNVLTIDLVLDRGAVLEGAVFTEGGEPLAGAEVKMQNKFSTYSVLRFSDSDIDAMPEGPEWLKTKSLPDGSFAIEGIKVSNEREGLSELLPSSGYFVTCSCKGYAVYFVNEFLLYRDRRNFLKITLRKIPDSAVVAGRVLDPDGRRVPNARVYYRAFERAADGSKSACGSGIIGTPVESNAMGEFSVIVKMSGLKIANGTVSNLMYVVAESPGYARTYAPVNVGPGTHLSDVSVVLESGNLVRGTVCDSEHRAIAGAQISLAEDGDSFGGFLETTTDDVGHFEVTGLRDLRYWAWVNAEGFVNLAAVEVRPGDLNLSFVMTPAPSLPSAGSSSREGTQSARDK
ncbi:MAG: carboxypeptidase regulatory-like domain-containing protein [Planctomycetes bacterium]|nr:carboxypeptidase regulatory-like domain-containing protein [Planctomycetota bacterium]